MRRFKITADLNGNATTLPIESCTGFGAIIKGLQLCDAHRTSDSRFADGIISVRDDQDNLLYTSLPDGTEFFGEKEKEEEAPKEVKVPKEAPEEVVDHNVNH